MDSTKIVCHFPNNKPWVTKDIKASLNRKKAAFRSVCFVCVFVRLFVSLFICLWVCWFACLFCLCLCLLVSLSLCLCVFLLDYWVVTLWTDDLLTHHNVFPWSFVEDGAVDIPVGTETLQTAELKHPNTSTSQQWQQPQWCSAEQSNWIMAGHGGFTGWTVTNSGSTSAADFRSWNGWNHPHRDFDGSIDQFHSHSLNTLSLQSKVLIINQLFEVTL